MLAVTLAVRVGETLQAFVAGGAFVGLVFGFVWMVNKFHVMQTDPAIEAEWQELERFGARREAAHKQATGRVWYESGSDAFFERCPDNSIRRIDA